MSVGRLQWSLEGRHDIDGTNPAMIEFRDVMDLGIFKMKGGIALWIAEIP